MYLLTLNTPPTLRLAFNLRLMVSNLAYTLISAPYGAYIHRIERQTHVRQK